MWTELSNRIKCWYTNRKLRIEKGITESNEFYIAPLYNDLIEQGKKIKNYRVNKLFCFGTPEDLNKTLNYIKETE